MDSEVLMKREFSQFLSSLASVPGGRLSVNDFPTDNLPKFCPSFAQLTVPTDNRYLIQGIEHETFSLLNGAKVSGMGDLTPERALIDSTGKKQESITGGFLTERVSTPSGSLFIRTDRPVNIRYAERKSIRELGFDYADFMPSAPDGQGYLYAVPQENLFKVSTCALALSSKTMNCYSRIKILSWHYGTLNLSVIPYRPKATYRETLILGCKDSEDFSQEIEEFLVFMQKAGFMLPVARGVLSDGSNLVLTVEQGSEQGFEPISPLSLAQVKAGIGSLSGAPSGAGAGAGAGAEDDPTL